MKKSQKIYEDFSTNPEVIYPNYLLLGDWGLYIYYYDDLPTEINYRKIKSLKFIIFNLQLN